MIIFEAGLNARACSSGHECISKSVRIWNLVIIHLKFVIFEAAFFVSFPFELSECHADVVLDGSWLEEKLDVLPLLDVKAWLILTIVGAASLPRHLADKV